MESKCKATEIVQRDYFITSRERMTINVDITRYTNGR